MFGRVALAVAVGALGLACGGDDEWATGKLPDAVCSLLDRLDAGEEGLSAPEVFTLDRPALAAKLTKRRKVLDRLVDETRGHLHVLIRNRARAQAAVDAA